MPAFTDDDFRDFVKLVQQAALEAYPNPNREGCPDPELLHTIAVQHWPSDHPVFRSHIAQCSPCIAALLDERTRFQAERRKHRRRIFLALASTLAVFCLVIAGLVLANRRPTHAEIESARKPPVQQQPASPSPTAPGPLRKTVEVALDIRSASPTRSAGQVTTPIFSVPAALANFRMTLPLGNEDGAYEVAIQAQGGQTVLNAHGRATTTAGTTVLNVLLNLSGIEPGEYDLYYRHMDQTARHRISLLVTK